MKRVKILAAICAASLMFGNLISCSQSEEPQSTPSDNSGNTDSGNEEKPSYDDSALSETTIFVVGDSTVCNYILEDGSFTDKTYYYPRYGWATQLSNYLSSKAIVKNLALSGRSSKSFLIEENYTTLKNEIKEGDFLIIGFGHNDEKSDDSERFTDASKDVTDPTSFKYSLYENYVKLAESKGATAIICSPIVRASSTDDYTGANGHKTATGDYEKAAMELGEEKNIDAVNLTSITAKIWKEAGYNEALNFHAIPQGTSTDGGVTVTPNYKTADTTHINVYGAKRIAYEFANAIYNSDSSLKPYINTGKLTLPTKENDLVKNPGYVWVDYEAADWKSYVPSSNFSTISADWYGTAFGDCGGDPTSSSNGFVATETSEGVFKVGQTGTTSPKGKINSTADGIAFAFKQLPVSKNFTLTAKAEVLTVVAGKNQAGFGLMLRDDCYTPNKIPVGTNYVSSSLYASGTAETTVNFSRESTKLNLTSNKISSLWSVGETAEFSIERVGQVVKVKTTYKGQTYEETYTDFDFVAKDSDYFYAGMFATRGTTAEFTELNLTVTGESQGA